MLSKTQVKMIRSLQTKKGREKHGLCLVEGRKTVEAAGPAVEFTFGPDDTADFTKLVTTETPQDIAAVARTPCWSLYDIADSSTVVLADGLQDPGNVGTVLRLCLGFGAALALVECADVTAPKVVRASTGSLFAVPWVKVARQDAPEFIGSLRRPVFRLERSGRPESLNDLKRTERIALLIGAEGSGITLDVPGTSVRIEHDDRLESLNVAQALAIALHTRYTEV